MSTDFQSLVRYGGRGQPAGGHEPVPTGGDGHDKYFDGIEWMVMTFVEGAAFTGDAKMVDQPKRTIDFVLIGWDDKLGGGTWWHEQHKGRGKNTCANGPATVECNELLRALPPPV